MRPSSSCSATAGNDVKPYEQFSLRNTGTEPAVVTIFTSRVGTPELNSCPADLFIHAFSAAVVSTSPTTGCLAGDDEAGPGACGLLSRTLAPGATEVIVVSTFSSSSVSSPTEYQLNVEGVGTFELAQLP